MIQRQALFLLILSSVDIATQMRPWSLNNFLMSGPKAYQLMFSGSVAAGVYTGVKECRYQFQWERWNCPESAFLLFPHKQYQQTTRETSFIQAVSAAGVMFILTRNCSLGDFDKCSCDDSRKGQMGGVNWKWGGCSDNVHFGERISRLFIDGLETSKDPRALVNLHNNEAGRKAVRKTLRLVCKCHGVSGSCSTKTCWQQLSDFRSVGKYLKRKYKRANRVDYLNGVLKHGNSAYNRELSSVSKTSLVFLDISPDYCSSNTTYGTVGTIGRLCKRPRKGEKAPRGERKSCRRLCVSCGLKVVKKTVEMENSCNCKFHWCCAVQCEKCHHNVTLHMCA